MNRNKTYSQEFRDKLIKEYEETSSLSEVSRRHGVAINTLRHWVLKKQNNGPVVFEKKRIQSLTKELAKKDLEIEILKDLLKKTNQAWLKE